MSFPPATKSVMADDPSRLELVKVEIDKIFGQGFSRDHPDLTNAVMLSAATNCLVAYVRTFARPLIEELIGTAWPDRPADPAMIRAAARPPAHRLVCASGEYEPRQAENHDMSKKPDIEAVKAICAEIRAIGTADTMSPNDMMARLNELHQQLSRALGLSAEETAAIERETEMRVAQKDEALSKSLPEDVAAAFRAIVGRDKTKH